MDPLVYTRKSRNSEVEHAPKKAKTASGRKSDDHHCLGFRGCDLYWLHGEGQNGLRAPLCRICRKSGIVLRRKICFSNIRQLTNSYLRCRHGQIGGIRQRIAASFTLISWFNSLQLLFFFSTLEKVTRRIEIWVEWKHYRRHGSLLCRPPDNVFFRRVKELWASLSQVYRVKIINVEKLLFQNFHCFCFMRLQTPDLLN